uniref:Uncharacterized protein n=1 Tax=Acrobeloides nanus TaxID=290746 RepID=A0A914DTT9_9BILA
MHRQQRDTTSEGGDFVEEAPHTPASWDKLPDSSRLHFLYVSHTTAFIFVYSTGDEESCVIEPSGSASPSGFRRSVIRLLLLPTW